LIGTVFLDPKKAFDLVDHNIFLHKFKFYNFSNISIKLFKSYLENRTQFVKYGNNHSNSGAVKSVVPQGSIFSPILFVFYLNGKPFSTTHSNIDMYADVTTMHASNITLKRFREPCNVMLMAINPKKTTCIWYM
jgi:hypothetical protein